VFNFRFGGIVKDDFEEVSFFDVHDCLKTKRVRVSERANLNRQGIIIVLI